MTETTPAEIGFQHPENDGYMKVAIAPEGLVYRTRDEIWILNVPDIVGKVPQFMRGRDQAYLPRERVTHICHGASE